MARHATVLFTQQGSEETTRNINPDISPFQRRGMLGFVRYTCDGTEVTGDTLDLVIPRLDNLFVIPELSRITAQGAGGVIIGAKLQKLSADGGTATDLSGVTNVSNNRVTMTGIATGPVAVQGNTESLRILLSTTASTTFTMTAGQNIDFELFCVSDQAF